LTTFSVAIIGTGFGRTVQALGFDRHPGFRLVAFAGRDEAKTRKAAGEFGVERAYTDWRRLFDDGVPDLVSIVTPVDLHHPMTLEALERGAHVLCEKPTALHRFQAAEMRDRAKALGRVAGINHEFRFYPARQLALDLVRRGAIGAPRRGEILGRYPLWHSPSTRAMGWLSERRRGGGILGALGSHHTDCLRLFLGEPVTAMASVRVQQPARAPAVAGGEPGVATADDACTVHYTFERGASGLVDLDATSPYRWERFEIHGEEATLRWDDNGYRLWRLAPGRDAEPIEIPDAFALERREGDPALVAPFTVLVGRLHAALAGEAALDPDFNDAVAVQSALDAARASSDAGVPVAVDRPPPA
jgi:predicted dehydrogenase